MKKKWLIVLVVLVAIIGICLIATKTKDTKTHTTKCCRAHSGCGVCIEKNTSNDK